MENTSNTINNKTMSKETKLREGLASLIPSKKENERKEELSPQVEELSAQPEESQGKETKESALMASVESEELKALLKKRQTMKRGRPLKDEASRIKQEQEYTRFCTLVKREHLAKLRAICLLETLTLKELLGGIYAEAIETYENKHGGRLPEPQPKTDARALFHKGEEQ